MTILKHHMTIPTRHAVVGCEGKPCGNRGNCSQPADIDDKFECKCHDENVTGKNCSGGCGDIVLRRSLLLPFASLCNAHYIAGIGRGEK